MKHFVVTILGACLAGIAALSPTGHAQPAPSAPGAARGPAPLAMASAHQPPVSQPRAGAAVDSHTAVVKQVLRELS